MSAQVLTYVFVGLTFGLYIAIAIWSRSGSTQEFYVAGGHVLQLPMAQRRQLTGCRLPLICPWPALSHLKGLTELVT